MFFPLPIAGWIALVSFALSPVGAQAQSGAAPAALQDVAQLSASGSVEVQQDLLTITLATTREGADPALVQAQL
ncbi:MAG: hypothetical protein LH479_08025, partial [Polaromonas sp.]|nr:hypothetical protein [Polaromonas sp.]